MTCDNDNLTLRKYTDDMALVGRVKDIQSLDTYLKFVNYITIWTEESFLQLNISKTKEMCCGANSVQAFCEPLLVNGEEVEQVGSFKYLGTEIDSQFSFDKHSDNVFKKGLSTWKLRSFNIEKDILMVVYKSLIESVLTFNIVSWFNSLSVKSKNKLLRIINVASKIIGERQTPLSDLFTVALKRKAFAIVGDSSHPLYSSFQLLPSGRRY